MGFKSDFLLWFIVIFLFALLLNLVKQFIKSLNQSSIEVEKNKCGVDCPIFFWREGHQRQKWARRLQSSRARALGALWSTLALLCNDLQVKYSTNTLPAFVIDLNWVVTVRSFLPIRAVFIRSFSWFYGCLVSR